MIRKLSEFVSLPYFYFVMDKGLSGKLCCMWTNLVTSETVFVEPACGEQDIVVTTSVQSMCVVRV